jgi:hypothetical protein
MTADTDVPIQGVRTTHDIDVLVTLSYAGFQIKHLESGYKVVQEHSYVSFGSQWFSATASFGSVAGSSGPVGGQVRSEMKETLSCIYLPMIMRNH